MLALAAERFFPARLEPSRSTRDRARFAANGLKLAAAIAGALAIYRAVAYEMPVLTAVPMDAGVAYVGHRLPPPRSSSWRRSPPWP